MERNARKLIIVWLECLMVCIFPQISGGVTQMYGNSIVWFLQLQQNYIDNEFTKNL